MMINFSDQKIKGKSWTESIYNFSSWKEPNKDEYFLQDVPVRVRLRATKVGRRISNPVSHIIYKVLIWITSLEDLGAATFKDFVDYKV